MFNVSKVNGKTSRTIQLTDCKQNILKSKNLLSVLEGSTN